MDWIYSALHDPSEPTIAILAFLVGLGIMIVRQTS
jgi:hypothetical protein